MALNLSTLQKKSVKDVEKALVAQYDMYPYHSSSFELLHFALDHQIKFSWFNVDLTMALLKLLQFFPDKSEWDYNHILHKILLKLFSENPIEFIPVIFCC